MSKESLARVLVVDDEEAVLRLISRILDASGYEVVIASDGLHAVELLATTTFDAIISDIDMPRMTGMQLLQAVRQGDFDVPVVLMTGAPSLASATQAVSLGATLYLTKPIDMTQLQETVARAVRLREVARLKAEALHLVDQGGLGPSGLLELRTSFERALGSMWLAYQPIVAAKDQSMFGYEALLRSTEPALPHPGAVLDAAERLGLLEQLGRKVRASAAATVELIDSDCSIFVNLHSRDLLDDTLLMADAPLSKVAHRIVLEITERASLDGIPDIHARLRKLREMGFRIAIDDLGAGYAGLTSFVTLNPQIVKLDMSLIRDIHKEPMKASIVRSMTRLCIDLGMLVVAEGVETTEELDILVDAGCDLLQGYLLGRPATYPSIA